MRYLRPDYVLDSDNADQGVSSLFDLIEVVSIVDFVVVWASLILFKIFVSEGNGSQ
jgi:hypothetical protein